jgi:hypothetical protein
LLPRFLAPSPPTRPHMTLSDPPDLSSTADHQRTVAATGLVATAATIAASPVSSTLQPPLPRCDRLSPLPSSQVLQVPTLTDEDHRSTPPLAGERRHPEAPPPLHHHDAASVSPALPHLARRPPRTPPSFLSSNPAHLGHQRGRVGRTTAPPAGRANAGWRRDELRSVTMQ